MADKPTVPPKEKPPFSKTLAPQADAWSRWQSTDCATGPTGLAPSLPRDLGTTATTRSAPAIDLPDPGDQVDDFEIIDVLGTGAFGVVYLARQISLDRQVALKITALRGDEGRTMAQLEHASIVQVFSEVADIEHQRRLLCMQYVSGTTLADALRKVAQYDPTSLSGAHLLAAVDRLTTRPTALDPAALRDRRALEQADWVETVCWIGSRLADALDHAHRQGVLHRDIKPANTLLTQYGRPMLVDFNLSFRQLELPGETAELFGGTLAYMAPEHLDAFNPAKTTKSREVDERSDIYSLGVLLSEMATGEVPFRIVPSGETKQSILASMAEDRRAPAPSLPFGFPASLDRTIGKCLEADPDQRYNDAGELAAALDGCRELRKAQREIPSRDRFVQRLQRRPLLWVALFCLLANVLSSIVNITYNQTQIVSQLTASQQRTFGLLVLSYNVPVYGLGLIIGARILLPLVRAWRAVRSGRDEAESLDRARRMSLALPVAAATICMIGWFPGGILFPAFLHLLSGPVPGQVFAHFLIDFTISGLIATTYSFLLVQCIVICVYYPALWSNTVTFRETAARELKRVAWWVRLFQFLAGLIPLIGAIMLLAVGPQDYSVEEYSRIRLLVIGLIALGIIGFHMSVFIGRRISNALAKITGETDSGAGV